MTDLSASADAAFDLPLAGVRVLELVDGPLLTVGRLLADLGAEVIRLEPPVGSPSRRSGILSEGLSLTDEVRNMNKTSVVADLATEEGRTTALQYAASAEILLHDKLEAELAGTGLERASLRSAFPRLVVVSLTDFGQTGPRSSWRGTADVHFAISSVLSRSGLSEVPEPLLPPRFLAYETAAMQAGWVVLLSYFNAVRTGRGEYVDFSVLEALLQVLDPPLGIAGTAQSGLSYTDIPRGRPKDRHSYPTLAAKDGWVRIAVLTPRQWEGVKAWLGDPPELADPKYNAVAVRREAWEIIGPYYARLFAGLTRAEAVEQGQKLGVPIAELFDVQEVMSVDHYREAGTFTEAALADGRTATVPAALFDIDGRLVGVREPAPALGSGAPAEHKAPSFDLPGLRPGQRPFEGLRVLDLGVIILGSELGRMFGDHGAEVIKIESREFPDGIRQIAVGEGMVWGQRNKKSLGLNLRNEEGRRLFRELVAVSDIVLTNFRAGTMDSLGFGYEELRRINPRILFSESSAFGNRGPWSRRAGYGPLVRASAGLAKLWTYPDVEGAFPDGFTVYPDHAAGRSNAVALIALLLRRARTGAGGWISAAQVDAIFSGLADSFALESLSEGTVVVAEGNDRGGDAPRGIFPAAGEDEWVVVDVVYDAAFQGLARTIGKPEWLSDPGLATAEGRLARAAELREAVTAWTMRHSPAEAARLLQAAGVPAGEMLRALEAIEDAHLVGRGAFGPQFHPLHPDPELPSNLNEARFENIPPIRLDPAPITPFQDTREVLASVLGYDDARIDALIASGGVQVADPLPAVQSV